MSFLRCASNAKGADAMAPAQRVDTQRLLAASARGVVPHTDRRPQSVLTEVSHTGSFSRYARKAGSAALVAGLWAVLAPTLSFAADLQPVAVDQQQVVAGSATELRVVSEEQASAEQPHVDSIQPTTAASLQEQASAGQPATRRPGLVKRTVRSYLSDDEAGEAHGFHLGPFFPRIEILSSGSGIAPMLHLWAPDLGGSPIDIHGSAAYSLYEYQYYDMQVGLVPHEGKRLPRVAWGTSAPFPLSDLEKTAAMPGFNIYASARYRDFPREDFYGIGPASLQSARSNYRFQDGLYEGIARLRVSRVSLMVRAGLLQTSIHPGADPAFPDTGISYDETTAPGLFRGQDFTHLSVGTWLELRDQPGNPHGGVSLGVAVSRFDDRLSNTYQFNRALVDAREYISLGSNRHVVALRQVTSLEKPDAGSQVPFYLQSPLGGSSSLRGYSSSRYRDEKVLALAGEYRFELRPKIELALIYESGKVFPTMREFGLQNLLHSYGGGIRLKSLREVRLRVDVMHSVEGTRVDVKFGPSF